MEVKHIVSSSLVLGVLWWLILITVFEFIGRFALLSSCRRVWNELLFCLLVVAAGSKKLSIYIWPVFRFNVFIIFARSSSREGIIFYCVYFEWTNIAWVASKGIFSNTIIHPTSWLLTRRKRRPTPASNGSNFWFIWSIEATIANSHIGAWNNWHR